MEPKGVFSKGDTAKLSQFNLMGQYAFSFTIQLQDRDQFTVITPLHALVTVQS